MAIEPRVVDGATITCFRGTPNALVQGAVDAPVAQTRAIERVVSALELKPIEFEGSDSLDDPSTVKG